VVFNMLFNDRQVQNNHIMTFNEYNMYAWYILYDDTNKLPSNGTIHAKLLRKSTRVLVPGSVQTK
jgi:hypothetical protein